MTMNNRSFAPTDAQHLDRVMSGLKGRLSETLRTIVDASEVAYVDYAVHGNTGDLVILAGALEFFRRSNINVTTYDNVYSAKFDELKRLPPEVAIICHGGGNFGDLYPIHQGFREKLVREMPERKIIVFPQSIHFSSDDAAMRSAEVFAKHPNFHLCVRDEESMRIGQYFTHNIYLVPDCAHLLWGQFAANNSGSGTLPFMRVDKESTGLSCGPSVDWETLSSPSFYKLQNLMQKLTKRVSRRPSAAMSKLAFYLWMIEVRRTIGEAYKSFSAVEAVETDRLHGMLFSLLLQKRVIFHDNSVKKLSRYQSAWLAELSDGWVKDGSALSSVNHAPASRSY